MRRAWPPRCSQQEGNYNGGQPSRIELRREYIRVAAAQECSKRKGGANRRAASLLRNAGVSGGGVQRRPLSWTVRRAFCTICTLPGGATFSVYSTPVQFVNGLGVGSQPRLTLPGFQKSQNRPCVPPPPCLHLPDPGRSALCSATGVQAKSTGSSAYLAMADESSSDDATKVPFTLALIAGGCAGTAVDVALYPLDTLRTRMQVRPHARMVSWSELART